MQILQIIASAQGANSYGTRLSQGIIDKLLVTNPGSQVVVRDLAKQSFLHLEESHLQAYFTPAESRSPEQQAVRHSDEAITQVMAAVCSSLAHRSTISRLLLRLSFGLTI